MSERDRIEMRKEEDLQRERQREKHARRPHPTAEGGDDDDDDAQKQKDKGGLSLYLQQKKTCAKKTHRGGTQGALIDLIIHNP